MCHPIIFKYENACSWDGSSYFNDTWLMIRGLHYKRLGQSMGATKGLGIRGEQPI
jgi:hypothetical protein